MELDPLILSRIQFAFVVSFHAIFPVFTIGLASYIAVLEGLAFKTENPVWVKLSAFWTKVFAVVFGMGVVSGIVMSFQFGTNWSNFAQASANSWMQTPAGTELRDGVFYVTSWSEAIFNPSFPYRFGHMALASFLTGGFVVAGVSAWYLLRGREVEANKKALSMCLWLLLFIAPAQAVLGDFHGLNTLEHQPTKVAAMEGNWETSRNVPLLLFAIPDQENQRNLYEIGIPSLASFILTHEWDGEVPGVSAVPVEEQPPVAIVFWSFRIMVGIGLLMIAFAVTGLVLRAGGRYWRTSWFLQGMRFMSIAPFFAVLTGWFVTEVGRAPWLVYGQMTQAEALTPSLTGGMALFTLIGYIVVYALVFSAGVYYLMRVLYVGLEDRDEDEHEAERPKRPFSAAHVPFEIEHESGRTVGTAKPVNEGGH